MIQWKSTVNLLAEFWGTRELFGALVLHSLAKPDPREPQVYLAAMLPWIHQEHWPSQVPRMPLLPDTQCQIPLLFQALQKHRRDCNSQPFLIPGSALRK